MQPLLVTAAVIIENGNILLTRRPDNSRHAGFWEFPGGKLDDGESPAEALKREILEELDITIEVGRIFETAYYRYDWGPVLILAYHCKIISGSIRNVGVAEHQWLPPRELSGYNILPADVPIVERLQKTDKG